MSEMLTIPYSEEFRIAFKTNLNHLPDTQVLQPRCKHFCTAWFLF